MTIHNKSCANDCNCREEDGFQYHTFDCPVFKDEIRTPKPSDNEDKPQDPMREAFVDLNKFVDETMKPQTLSDEIDECNCSEPNCELDNIPVEKVKQFIKNLNHAIDKEMKELRKYDNIFNDMDKLSLSIYRMVKLHINKYAGPKLITKSKEVNQK